MACLLAPLTEAVIITAANKLYNKISTKSELIKIKHNKKIEVLNNMLYGGSFLLALEHIYHGEIIFSFPFLTAVRDGNTHQMLTEIATSGVAMALLVTSVWAAGCFIFEQITNTKKGLAI